MPAIWKGVISFGLVSIPISVHSAVRKEEIKLRMVRRKDLSPVNYKRVAEADGAEVPWSEIVKAYEYEKGAFVPLEEEDFKRAQAQGVQSIEIIDFVPLREIDPLFYDKPYFLQPGKGGAHPYALLRDALLETNVVGIAKVVIRSKQHLAALKPQGKCLLLELLHFADELVDASTLQAPAESATNPKEMQLAKSLIDSMTTRWNATKYHDDYTSALLEIIEEKVKAGAKGGSRRAPNPKLPGNVVDMVAMLERSLQGTEPKGKVKPKARKTKKAA